MLRISRPRSSPPSGHHRHCCRTVGAVVVVFVDIADVTSRGHDSQHNIPTRLPHRGTRSRSSTSLRRAAGRRATPIAMLLFAERLPPPCDSGRRTTRHPARVPWPPQGKNLGITVYMKTWTGLQTVYTGGAYLQNYIR
jgi:hypothetical protein